MQILGYSIFLIAIIFIMGYVGYLLHLYGKVFLIHLFNHDAFIADRINNLLLVGYYLVNIGYAVASISTWGIINTYYELWAILFNKLGIIMMLLSCIHLCNVLVLINLSHFQKFKF